MQVRGVVLLQARDLRRGERLVEVCDQVRVGLAVFPLPSFALVLGEHPVLGRVAQVVPQLGGDEVPHRLQLFYPGEVRAEHRGPHRPERGGAGLKCPDRRISTDPQRPAPTHAFSEDSLVAATR